MNAMFDEMSSPAGGLQAGTCNDGDNIARPVDINRDLCSEV